MFHVGDTVKLKSDSPEMTVAHIRNNAAGIPTVRCTWFEGTQSKTGSFPAAGLKAAQAEGERLHYVQCVGYPQRPYDKIRIKVELGRENDEPAEMLLSFDEAQRLRGDLANQLLERGIPSSGETAT
jgi:uncharacterized protein YodC (DUF2158 family)